MARQLGHNISKSAAYVGYAVVESLSKVNIWQVVIVLCLIGVYFLQFAANKTLFSFQVIQQYLLKCLHLQLLTHPCFYIQQMCPPMHSMQHIDQLFYSVTVIVQFIILKLLLVDKIGRVELQKASKSETFSVYPCLTFSYSDKSRPSID